MKLIIFTILVVSSNLIISQDTNPFVDPLAYKTPITGFLGLNYAIIKTPHSKNEIKGEIYVFKGWKNRGVLRIDNNEFKLSNINFNMQTNKIESRVGKDSVYIFDLTNVDHLFINNRKFKNYYLQKNSTNKIFELVYDGDDLKMLKGFEIGIKKGEVDPLMVKKTEATYYTTIRYYIKKGKNIEEIKLRKKDIAPLFNKKANLINDFAKENKLSYKSEKDITKLLNYFSSI